MVKNLPANAGDMSLIPVLGRSPRGGNGNALQYSYLENPMDRGLWQATVHGLVKIWTQLSTSRSKMRDSLVVYWLRLHAPNARGLGSIPCQGTRSHMLQVKILHACHNKDSLC